MKTLTALLMLLLLAVTPADAKKKEPPVYDQTGTVFLTLFHSDYQSSMTVNGETYNAYCNADDHSISCTDRAGVFEVKLADGRTMVLGDEAWIFSTGHFKLYEGTVYSPVAHNMITSGRRSDSFQYRLAKFKLTSEKTDFMCVQYVAEDRGRSKGIRKSSSEGTESGDEEG